MNCMIILMSYHVITKDSTSNGKTEVRALGAPVAIHEADSDIVSQTTRGKDYKDRLPNGNYLDNTANHFVLFCGDNPGTALISMKSTQLKVSRKWNSMMMGIKMQGKNGLFTPPTYSHIYNLKTVQHV